MTQPHYIDRGLVDDLQQCFDQRISCAAASPCASVTGGDTVYVELATMPAELLKRAIEALSRPMEAVAWRYPVLTARDEAVARMARAMRNGKAWPAVFQANTAEALAEDALTALEALAVIPTEGGGND